uniref:AlNc14C257G9738 protein n=1 Tax=Albugo laibachii Nc14 TaxID=890382 RepID=F0WTR3_9STRA|nr:AlNc14C257G9738 [Albugo laibachii Nc14]|eukprot:CCA24756.1 AlNc14C257G9738 [Albugo laibachii Nc14]
MGICYDSLELSTIQLWRWPSDARFIANQTHDHTWNCAYCTPRTSVQVFLEKKRQDFQNIKASILMRHSDKQTNIQCRRVHVVAFAQLARNCVGEMRCHGLGESPTQYKTDKCELPCNWRI